MRIKSLPAKRAMCTALVVLSLFLLVPAISVGQEAYSSVTVNEDEYPTTNGYVPFNGQFSMEHPTYSQFIIPASDLSELQYGNIGSLTFYLDKEMYYGESPQWDYSDMFQVYLVEVDQEVFTPSYSEENYSYYYELYDWNRMEMVYDGYVEVTENEDCYAVKIPNMYYQYEGGNLLIGIKPYQCEHYYDCMWIGKSLSQGGGYEDGYSAVYSYYEDWSEQDVVYGEGFLPKMTIEYYTYEYQPSCFRPRNLQAEDLQAHNVTLSWSPQSGESQWDIAITTNLDPWSYEALDYTTIDANPYVLTGLDSETTYKVLVRAHCDNWNYSEPASIIITTIKPSSPTCLTPRECDTPEGNTAILEWNYGDGSESPMYWDIAYTMGLETSPDEVDYITVGDCEGGYWCGDYSHQLTGLMSFGHYRAWVRANYGNGDFGTWSEPCEFMPTNLENSSLNWSTDNSYTVPFRTLGGSSRSQFIIPASSLSDLVNHEIWRIYFAYGYTAFPDNTVDIYLTEIEADEFSVAEYYDWNDMDLVLHQGSVVTHQCDNSCTTNGSLDFDTPYYYQGGNLLVGVVAQVAYNSSYVSWRGKNKDNHQVLSSTGTNAPAFANFLPATSIYYSPDSEGKFLISVTAEPADAGSVSGGGQYDAMSECVLNATPHDGYSFVHWTRGEEVVSADSTYQFTVTESAAFTAHFTLKSYEVSAEVDPEQGGAVSGAGTFLHNDTCTLVATPSTGYAFVNWSKNGEWISGDPEFSFQVTESAVYTAHFIPQQYQVSIEVAPSGSGTVSGGGTYNYHSVCSLTATANQGYSFACWKKNGVEVSSTYTYSFVVTEDVNITAVFNRKNYQVNAYANPSEGGEVTGGGTYLYQDTCTLTATANPGFIFENWTKNDIEVSNNAEYSFTVTENATYTANFFPAVYDVQAVTCDELEWNGHLYTLDGTYYDTLTAASGRDSIVALHLTVNHSYYETFEVSACDSYTWEGNVYTASGEDSRTYQTEHGCDSVLTLQLTIHPSYQEEFYEEACDSYTWEGHLYEESGDYEVNYQTQHQCDSTLTLHLVVHPTRPLGAFTALSPAEGHVFHENVANFHWNSVENALTYDFYLWEEGQEQPAEPTAVALTATEYQQEELTYDVVYHWCVVARNECDETSTTISDFTCHWVPVLDVVPHGSLAFGEVEIGKSFTKTIAVSASALAEDISLTFLDDTYGQDADCFDVQVSGWQPKQGGLVHITFTPNTSRLYYNAALKIASAPLSDTLYLSGMLANRFVFETHVDEAVYTDQDEIVIHGHVEDVMGHPLSDLSIEVYLMVMGTRVSLPATSDQNGDYQVIYHPRSSESGYYQIGSCTWGSMASEVHDAFNIPGMNWVSNDYVIWEVERNDTLTGSLEIRNRSLLPLTNIRVVPVDVPEGCEVSFSALNLGGNEKGRLDYTITGTVLSTSNSYEEASFVVTCDEGVSLTLNCLYYCREGKGVMEVYPPSVYCTAKRGSQKNLSFLLVNTGNQETGPITVDLPAMEWMSMPGGNVLASVPAGDSCSFQIALFPDESVALNQHHGNIALNCGNGNGINIPYMIETTTDSTGTLIVDVTDDYTYNTNGGLGPHLADAQVTLRGYYSLEQVAQGVTDENGMFTVENLPEGYYILNVQARSHAEYNRGVLYVEAGKTNRHEVFLQFQAISYSWVVVPTEVEDAYDFELVCDIKTNVPVPVVVIDCPRVLDSIPYGDSLQFEMTISNYGLIDAYETQLTMPQLGEYDFYPLFDFVDTLKAKSTVVVPCTMTRTHRGRSEDDNCNKAYIQQRSWYHCNNKKEWVEHTVPVMVVSLCIPLPSGGLPTHDIVFDPQPPVPWDVHLPYLYLYSGPVFPRPDFHIDAIPSWVIDLASSPDEDCTPCWKAVASALVHAAAAAYHVPYLPDALDCLLFDANGNDFMNLFKAALYTTPVGMAYHMFTGDHVRFSKELTKCMVGVGLGVVGDLKGGAPYKMVSTLQEIGDVAGRLASCISTNPNRDNAQTSATIEQFEQSAACYQAYLEEFDNLFPEEEWLYEEQIDVFMEHFSSLMDTSTFLVSEQAALYLKAISELDHVNDTMIQHFVDRWNRSVGYWSQDLYKVEDLPEGYDPDFIQIDTLMFEPVKQAQTTATSYGFASVREMFESSMQALRELSVEHTNDVCAKVSVSFKQTMAMTREAFEGTLKIYNGHDSDPMENVRMDLVIKDENGVDCTSLFQVNVGSLDQITGVDGTGTVQAQQEGMVRLVMIPTVAAAPTTPKVYSFGGSFSFLDPFSGEEMTYPLYPVELTVNPSPELHVDYFIQRHIISDDPLTEDTIEATEPAELAMMIRNVGMGTAKNVYLESSQPEVIDNQNGLLIQFDMVGSSMNGEARPMGLTDIPFGNLLPQSAGIAEWYFTSTLMARVLRSTPHFIHNNSYGNPDLSLVTEVHSHELIKAVRAYGALEDEINDFLVNEEPDFNHVPDRIYFSHGGMVSVKQTLDITAEGTLTPDQRTVQLHLNPAETGWNYAEVDDPAQGQYAIVRCIRDDGQEIPLNNVWITHVTMFDDDAPIHENKLHIVDTLAELRSFTYNVEYAVDSAADAETSLHIDLSTGWNWFSTHLECTPTSLTELEDALSELSGTAVVKSQHSFVTLESEVWNGSIEYNNEEMFMINVGLDCGLSLTGSRAITANHPVTLSCGWNWIGYPVQQEMGLEEALSQLSPTEGDVIKSQSVFSSYSAQDGWSGSLDHLTPGRGYMYLNRSSEANTLLYPSAAKGTVDHRALTTHWKHDEHRYATNLSMMVTLDAMEFALSADAYEIGAFVDGDCRGSARLQQVGDRYVAFLSVSGEKGETVHFRLYDVLREEEYAAMAEEYVVYEPDAVLGAVKSPMVLHFTQTGVEEQADSLRLFPNPTDGQFTVSGTSLRTVRVYDMMGQLLLDLSCGNADQAMVDLSGFSAGVYTVSVLLANGQMLNKLVVKD